MALPRIAYILLWFPKPSETFIFREVVNLWQLGLPLQVFTLYGELRRHLSPEMAAVSPRVVRLGTKVAKNFPEDLRYWARRRPEVSRWLWRTVPLRKWRSLEVGGENLWAFLCGFFLARRFAAAGFDHIHAPWGNGPATAAWVASRLSGIPFSFTGRAIDVRPPDGALPEKIADSVLVRAESRDKLAYLQGVAPRHSHKMVLTYNGVPLNGHREAPVPLRPPYRLLALGRFARFKGFEVLLQAARLLQEQGVDFHLTLAGAGPRGPQLRLLTRWLGVAERVSFPGFVTHDRVADLFCNADIFVMPSIVHPTGESDGLPTVILEALAHRLPVVATEVAGIAEVVRPGETGWLVPPGNPTALAAALARVVSDRPTALTLASRGRSLVQKVFDPGCCHQRVLDIFTQVCADSRNGVAPGGGGALPAR